MTKKWWEGPDNRANQLHELRLILKDGSSFLQYDTWDNLIRLVSSFSGKYRKFTMKPVSGDKQ